MPRRPDPDDDFEDESDRRPARPKSRATLPMPLLVGGAVSLLGLLGLAVVGAVAYRMRPAAAPPADPTPPAAAARPADPPPTRIVVAPPASDPLAPPPANDLFGSETAEDGVRWRRMRPTPDGDPLAGAVWAADGTAGFALTRGGRITRFRYPQLTAEADATLPHTCDGLAMCKLGPVVTAKQDIRAMVLDPATLRVRHFGGLGPIQQPAVVAPELPVIYLIAGGEDHYARGSAACLLDVAAGRGSTFTADRPPPLADQFGAYQAFPCAAADPLGRYFWTEAARERIGRYRIDGQKLTLEAVGPEIGPGRRVRVCPSPDGKLVCLPAALAAAVPVFRTDALDAPAFTLPTGQGATVVGFDTTGKRALANSNDHPFMVFDEAGTRRRAARLGRPAGGGAEVRGILPHPAGGAALVWTTNSVTFATYDP